MKGKRMEKERERRKKKRRRKEKEREGEKKKGKKRDIYGIKNIYRKRKERKEILIETRMLV